MGLLLRCIVLLNMAAMIAKEFLHFTIECAVFAVNSLRFR